MVPVLLRVRRYTSNPKISALNILSTSVLPSLKKDVSAPVLYAERDQRVWDMLSSSRSRQFREGLGLVFLFAARVSRINHLPRIQHCCKIS